MASQRPLGADPLDSGHRHLSSAQTSHPSYDRETSPQPRVSWKLRVHWGTVVRAYAEILGPFLLGLVAIGVSLLILTGGRQQALPDIVKVLGANFVAYCLFALGLLLIVALHQCWMALHKRRS